MKGIFVGNDMELSNQIVSLGESISDIISISNKEQYEAIGASKSDYGFIVISDRAVTIENLDDFVKNVDIEHKFYLISNDINAIVVNNAKIICSNLSIFPVMPKNTIQSIAKTIVQKVTRKEFASNNVVVFASSLPNIGATHTCYCVCERISELTDESVALINANPLDNGEMFTNYHGVRLADIQSQVNGGLMSGRDLKQKMHKVNDKFYVLSGNSDIRARNRYPIQTVENIVNALKAEFSLVVVDCGSSVENSLTVGSILQGEMRFLFVNQTEKSILATKNMFEQVLHPLNITESGFLGVLLKEDDSLTLVKSDVERKTKIPIVGGIPAIDSKTIDRMENERKTILSLKGTKKSLLSSFESGIDKIVRSIASNYRFKYLRKSSGIKMSALLSLGKK